MNIGVDLFLQMIKGMYPGYSEAFSEQYRDWLHEAGQNFFDEMSAMKSGDSAEVLFKSWMNSTQKEFAKGKHAFDFEIQGNLMQRIIQNGNLYIKFMNTVLEAAKATTAGKKSDEALNEIYQKVTQHYLEFYQESVGKYLGVPQFGIQRETLHQLMAAIDAYHGFMATVGEFLARFNLPLKDSMEILQKAVREREEADDSFKSAKEVYNFTVNILEKKYDDFLKSPEGVKNVVNVVEKYMEYRKKLNKLNDAWFRSLAIPTRREMQDVYKGIHDLKKKTRKQDAIIREQNELIKNLNRKIQKLEVSSRGSVSKKKSVTADRAQRKTRKKTSGGASQKAKTSRG